MRAAVDPAPAPAPRRREPARPAAHEARAPIPAPPPSAQQELLAIAGPGRLLDVDADGFAGEGYDAAISTSVAAAHPRPRKVASALTAAVRPGGTIALAATPGTPWHRYETAYRHLYGMPGFDVLEREGYVIVLARRR